MASVNKVILIGNCGRDPEVRYASSGDAIANVSVATTSKHKDKSSGEWKEETEWHRVVFFGHTADVVAKYVKKGSSMYVEGRLRTRKWTDKDGIEKYTTEIVCDVMKMLGGKDKSERQGEDTPARKPSQPAKPAEVFDDLDDIPW